MTYEQICDLFDNDPNMTLKKLSRITGKPPYYLQLVLLFGKEFM